MFLFQKIFVENLIIIFLDEAYTRKVHNFSSIQEMYKWSSSINYLENIEKPVIFINSKDDPLVPETLLEPIRNFASKFKIEVFKNIWALNFLSL